MEGYVCTNVSILTEGHPRNSYAVFSKVLHGENGVCITRLHPEYVIEKFGPMNAQFYWLSKMKDKSALPPNNISTLVKQVRKEIEGGCKRFFLDGLEYLLLWNDMNAIINAMQEIDKLLVQADGSMMISIDPLTFEERDLRKFCGCFPQIDLVKLNAGSQHIAADEPAGKGQIDAGLLVSKGLIATP